METVALADLAPILAAVLGPILLFAVAIMRYLHLDSNKTRDLIDEARKENREITDRNRDLIDEARKENRELIERNRDLIERNRDGLADLRERLARIEGHLRIGLLPSSGADDGGAEAA